MEMFASPARKQLGIYSDGVSGELHGEVRGCGVDWEYIVLRYFYVLGRSRGKDRCMPQFCFARRLRTARPAL